MRHPDAMKQNQWATLTNIMVVPAKLVVRTEKTTALIGRLNFRFHFSLANETVQNDRHQQRAPSQRYSIDVGACRLRTCVVWLETMSHLLCFLTHTFV